MARNPYGGVGSNTPWKALKNSPEKQKARAERMGVSLDDPRVRKARKFYGGRAKAKRQKARENE